MDSTVVIHTYTYPSEVFLLKTKLEEAGIPVFTFEEKTISVDPFLSQAIGGLKLRVPVQNETLAREIVKQFYQSLPRTEEGNEAAEKANFEPVNTWCPKCDSTQVFAEKTTTSKGIFAFLLALMLAIPWSFMKRRHRCFHCGYEWESN